MTTSIVKPRLLLVEGRDEENFFAAALKHHARSDVQVLQYGGKGKLGPALKALANDPAFPNLQGLAVVRDADSTPAGSQVTAAAAALNAVRGALAAIRQPCPAAHAQFTAGLPRIGVFIMPDGASDGMLESLCVSAVAALPEFPCLTQFFTCCQQHGAVPNNMHKARAHAWLATRPDPDKRVGEAALAGYWPFSDPAFVPLWTFLQAL